MPLSTAPSTTLRRLTACAAAIVALAAATGAHAAPAVAPPLYAVAMTLDAHGDKSAPRVLAKAGEPFAVASGGWRVEMTVNPAQDGDDVWVTGKILRGNEVVSAPTVRAHLDEPATVRVADGDAPFTLSLTVARQP